MYINTTTQQQLSEAEIRAENPNTSFPSQFIPPEGYAYIFPAPLPVYDPLAQQVLSAAPELTPFGHWEQRWQVIDLPVETAAANQAQATKSATLAQIASLEASVTPRRNREALLTDMGKNWLASVDSQIADCRASL